MVAVAVVEMMSPMMVTMFQSNWVVAAAEGLRPLRHLRSPHPCPLAVAAVVGT